MFKPNKSHVFLEGLLNTTLSPAISIKQNNYIIQIFLLIWFGILIQCINIFGIVTNVINIICFVKQGLKDAVNVSLLGLAISDTGCVVTMVWSGICVIPQFQEADLPFDPVDINYMTTSMPHVVFTRVTSTITALIMVERCLCITMPLKVKTMLSAQRVGFIVASIYVIISVCVFPVFSASSFAWEFDPRRNKTILGMTSTEDRWLMEQVSFAINQIFLPYVTFVVIIVCMVIITIALWRQARWRQKCTATVSEVSTSDRDQKIAKMVVMISVLFVVCFTPSAIVFLVYLIVPGFQYGGMYHDVVVLSYGICVVLESANSSINIFIYYQMSSRYRACFRQLFRKGPGNSSPRLANKK